MFNSMKKKRKPNPIFNFFNYLFLFCHPAWSVFAAAAGLRGGM
jgi:hypothetical protein